MDKLKPPCEYFGFRPGEDRKLIDWIGITSYLTYLGRESDRIEKVDIGETTEGRLYYYLLITSPGNLQQLDKIKDIQGKLADPRKLTAEEESVLVEQGKTIVMITCSIHATEVGATQMTPELAFELATGSGPEIIEILDNVVLLLVPSLNPDGLDMVCQWYAKTVNSCYEGTAPPYLYHKYAGHDNNRDWFMLNLVETKLAVEKIHNVWHPQIVYDIHQMGEDGFRFFLPPYLDPYESNVHPLIIQKVSLLGLHMMGELLAKGKKGVSCYNTYDAFAPSRAYQHYHGGVRILSEAASAKIATPVEKQPEQLKPTRGGADPGQAGWNHPVPWPGGKWALGDIMEYNKIACMACLRHAARFRKDWLAGFLQIGRDACKRRVPYAYVFPAGQKDPGALNELLKVLMDGQVEIHKAMEEFDINGVIYSSGSYVVKLAQPYGPYAKTLLEVQNYPDLRLYPGGPPRLPYDVTGHTLPLMMGVKTILAQNEFKANLERVHDLKTTRSRKNIRESDKWIALSPNTNRTFKIVNSLLEDSIDVFRTAVGFRHEGRYIVPGTYLIEIKALDTVEEKCEAEGISLDSLDLVKSPMWQIKRARLGVYKSYCPTAEEGWLRYILEQYEFPYSSLENAAIRQGGLNSNFDTIIFPSQSEDIISHGISQNHYPQEYAGGLEEEGKFAISEFIENGGTCIFIDAAADWAVSQLGLQCVNVLAGKDNSIFFAPGSILRAIFDTEHPLAYGMSTETPVFFLRGRAWEAGQGLVLARYPRSNPLLSGWLFGGQYLHDRAALIDYPLREGRVVLIGFRPYFRGQARATYKIIFNAIHLGSSLRI